MKRILLCLFSIISFALPLKAQLNLQWQELGPDNLGGPVRSLILDNRDSTRQTLYAGVMGGGVWKSTDGAASWNFLGCSANFNVGCMAQASNGTIYVGTGDGLSGGPPFITAFESGFLGNGIYKLDSADNFISLSSTVPSDTSSQYSLWNAVNRIAINPLQTNELIAATEAGLYESVDTGNTWTLIVFPLDSVTHVYENERVIDVKWSGNGEFIYATFLSESEVGELIMSSNGGQTWSLISGNDNPGFPAVAVGRIETAMSPSNSNVVYLSIAATNGSTYGVYRSLDAGNTWDTVALASSEFDPFGSDAQGWFDNAIIVSSADSSKIYEGGTSMYSYSPQTGINHLTNFLYPNADTGQFIDQFMYAINDLNPNEMYVATDRGVFKCTEALSNFTGAQFSAANDELKGRDFISVAAAQNGQVIGGSELDDGLLVGYLCAQNQNFSNFNIGTGYCDFSHLDTNYVFLEQPFGYLYESHDGLATYATALDSNIDPNSSGYPSRCGNFYATSSSYLASLLLHETKSAFATNDSVLFVTDTSLSIGNVVNVTSNTANTIFQYSLPASLSAGDSIMVPDPVKSNLFLGTDCGIWMKLHALEQTTQPDWFNISNAGVNCLAVTANGNKVYGGSGNQIISVAGLNLGHYTNYNMTDSFQYSVDSIVGPPRIIQSICVDPNNDNNLLLTLFINFGDTIPNAYKSTDGGMTWAPLQIGPVGTMAYSCVIDAANGSDYIVGTNHGIWTSADAGLSCQQDDSSMCDVTVFQVREISLYADDCNVLYAATSSRGLWRSVTLTPAGCNTTLASGACDSATDIHSPSTNNGNFIVYPNPATSYTTVEFSLSEPQQVSIQVHDIIGRLTLSVQQFLPGGNQKVELNISALHAGTYLVSVGAGQMQQTKLLVIGE